MKVWVAVEGYDVRVFTDEEKARAYKKNRDYNLYMCGENTNVLLKYVEVEE